LKITYQPIGVIHSPFTDLKDMPIQPASRHSAPGTVEIYPQYLAGLQDLDGFSHIILIYHLHRVTRTDLTVTPFLDIKPHGVFATRAPTRPNPIGLSIVHLQRIEAEHLYVESIDILDGTPLLDIKPYVPDFDQPEPPINLGWLQSAPGRVQTFRSDERFVENDE
jgi:tRNA-Thr(GGU) m(6)t(6)A37 methyltransferase TsaA